MTDIGTAEHMLTTVDNPFNPFTQFDQWNAFDMQKGYYTLSFLARVVITSPLLSPLDQFLAEEMAIEEIARENVSGMHRRVTIDYDPRNP